MLFYAICKALQLDSTLYLCSRTIFQGFPLIFSQQFTPTFTCWHSFLYNSTRLQLQIKVQTLQEVPHVPKGARFFLSCPLTKLQTISDNPYIASTNLKFDQVTEDIKNKETLCVILARQQIIVFYVNIRKVSKKK